MGWGEEEEEGGFYHLKDVFLTAEVGDGEGLVVDAVEQDDEEVGGGGMTKTVGTRLDLPACPPAAAAAAAATPSVTEWLVDETPEDTPEVECLENLVALQLLLAVEKALWQDWREVMDPR